VRNGGGTLTTFASALSEADRCFAACAAHELRGSITVQRTLAEVALADPNADTAALREMGEQVAAACKRQERLLEALLTLARADHRRLRREPVDLAATVAEVMRSDTQHGPRRTTTLEPARTTGDPQLIERLVANLLANAVRHNVPGGWVAVATYTAVGRATFTIANTGPLIATDELGRLFEPFERLSSHAGRSGEGVGLGLAIVQAIANAHDATLTAQARTSGGLRIDIDFRAETLPVVPARRRADVSPGRGSRFSQAIDLSRAIRRCDALSPVSVAKARDEPG
jgi:signal transduction histidine kinase